MPRNSRRQSLLSCGRICRWRATVGISHWNESLRTVFLYARPPLIVAIPIVTPAVAIPIIMITVPIAISPVIPTVIITIAGLAFAISIAVAVVIVVPGASRKRQKSAGECNDQQRATPSATQFIEDRHLISFRRRK